MGSRIRAWMVMIASRPNCWERLDEKVGIRCDGCGSRISSWLSGGWAVGVDSGLFSVLDPLFDYQILP